MKRLFTIAALCAICSAGPAAADVVLLADDFNTETLALNYTGFTNWNVPDGTVDVIGAGFFDLLPGHGRYVDLDGSTGNAGRLESKTLFTLDPGDYRLDFLLAGSQRGDTNTVGVSLGSAYTESFTLPSAAPFALVTRNITVAAGTTGRLVFDHLGGDNLGLLLDDVTLTQVTGTPEPGSLAFVAFGAVGLVLARRRGKV